MIYAGYKPKKARRCAPRKSFTNPYRQGKRGKHRGENLKKTQDISGVASGNKFLRTLRDIASLINASNDYSDLLNHIVDTICNELAWTRSAIMVLDRKSGYSRLASFRDRNTSDKYNTVSWDLISSPTLRVAETREPLILTDIQNDERFPTYQEFARQLDLKTIILLPLSCTDLEGRDMVFTVAHTENLTITDAEIDSLLTVSHLISIAVDKYKLFQAEQATNSQLRALHDSNSSLMAQVIHGCTLDEITTAIAQQIGLPVAVTDQLSDSFVWSEFPEPLAHIEEETRLAFINLLNAELRQIIATPHLHGSVTELRLAPKDTMDAIKLDVIAFPLIVSNQAIGGLIVFPHVPFTDDFLLLGSQGAQHVMSAYFMRTYAPWIQETTAIAAFFRFLFDGDWHNPDQINHMAQRVGVNLTLPSYFIVADLLPLIEESMALCRVVESAARQFLPNSVVFFEQQFLFLYCPVPSTGNEKIISRIEEEIYSQISWRTDIKVATTISPQCRLHDDFKQVRNHCLQAFRLARLFEKTGRVRIEDFGSFAVLISALGDSAMKDFVHKTLHPIVQHDQNKNGALLECSEQFLHHGCRYQAAADALDIHVSTLRYRLKRVQELFDLDLENNEDDRFTLSLALKIRTLQG